MLSGNKKEQLRNERKLKELREWNSKVGTVRDDLLIADLQDTNVRLARDVTMVTRESKHSS